MLRPHAPAVLLVTALALAGCGSDSTSATPTTPATTEAGTPATTPAPSPSPSAAASPAAEPEPVVTPDDAQSVSITVAGGEISGDTGRVEVPVGTRVRLSVTSDVADEIHVHGFDLTSALSPGQATQVEFVADRPGIFEVELHDARKVLTRLQIS